MADRKIRGTNHFSVSHLSVSSLFACVLLSLSACAQNDAAPREPQPLTGNDRKLLRTFLDEFVEITPGKGRFPKSFEMGSSDGPASERPVRTVTFDYNFAIAKYEIPQNLYTAVMGNNPSVWQGPGRERNSAEMMTWREAVMFCERVTRLLRAEKLIGDDEVIRLPSEAEWEYCCRAGTTTAWSFGDEATAPGDAGAKASRLDAYAWHTGNAAGNDPAVGVLKPNPWGLYDMHGYLWEYVQDVWHENYESAPTDGSARHGDAEPGGRVMRGGSWRDHHRDLRSATRRPVAEQVRSDAVGFRCVKARPLP